VKARQPGRSAAAGRPGQVRIIAGRLRGSKLAVPPIDGLRPTADRVRETLFNWLMPVLPGARCLDLYAGTGALGIEAASRGAREVVLVERDRRAAQALRDNLARLKVEGASVAEADAIAFLAGPARPFDCVFLDPPFAAGAWGPAMAGLERGWLAPGALVYVESPAATAPETPAAWSLHRELRAGQVRAALYRRAPAP
jgi:16S rRNA (guanine966-N2)-methyltransferase